jgi:hypothetical protein
MNANELADLVECACCAYQKEAATMLRQQADRIGVLEAEQKIQLNIAEKQFEYIDHLEQGLRASIDLNKAQAERAQGK